MLRLPGTGVKRWDYVELLQRLWNSYDVNMPVRFAARMVLAPSPSGRGLGGVAPCQMNLDGPVGTHDEDSVPAWYASVYRARVFKMLNWSTWWSR